MHQVKIFKSIENELWNMEGDINKWIKETGAKVINVTGNIAPQTGNQASSGAFSASDVLIIVHYELPE